MRRALRPAELIAQGFAASAWLDGRLLGSVTGSKTVDEFNVTYALPSLSSRSDSILTVLIDNMGTLARASSIDPAGLEETGEEFDIDFSRRPRGIRGYKLDSGVVTDWRVAGRLGGSVACVTHSGMI